MRWGRVLGWTLGGVALTGAALFAAAQTAPVKRLVASLASSDEMRISGISGFVPTDLQVAKIEMRDGQGAWLTIEDARVRWSFGSLFTGRVRIDEVAAHRISVERPPLPSDKPSPPSSGGSSTSRGCSPKWYDRPGQRSSAMTGPAVRLPGRRPR